MRTNFLLEELLFENRIDDDKKKYPEVDPITIEQLASRDPSGNNKYLEWLAKNLLKKNDILVSRLKGNIAFTVILEEKDNLVCTNGVCVLRPKDEDAMLIIFANLFSSEFKIQHQALTTGSIMETLSDDDIKNIIINIDDNEDKYRKILDSIKIIQEEMTNI